MTMSVDGYVAAFPGQIHSYRYEGDDPDESGIVAVMQALDALRRAWEPLSAEAEVGIDGADSFDARPDRPHLLVRNQLPPCVLVDSMMVDPVISTAATLSKAALVTWLTDALASCSPSIEARGARWKQLRFDAARARLGPPDWKADRVNICLASESGPLTLPLERDATGTWVSGPRAPALNQPPLGVSIVRRWGGLRLDLTVHYSFWLDGEIGATQLAETASRWELLGWRR